MEAIRNLASLITKSKKICILTGAGISAPANIPDFRSDDRFKFDKHAFETDEEWPGMVSAVLELYRLSAAAKPTKTHKLVEDLHHQGKLLRYYTENADGLERGLPSDISDDSVKCVRLQGTFQYLQCCACGMKYPTEEFLDEHLPSADEAPDCPDCMRSTKLRDFGKLLPDVTPINSKKEFKVSRRVKELLNRDMHTADLLLIMGTNLELQGVFDMAKNIAASVCSRNGAVALINSALPKPAIKECPDFQNALLVQCDCDELADYIQHIPNCNPEQKPRSQETITKARMRLMRVNTKFGKIAMEELEKAPTTLVEAIGRLPSCRWSLVCEQMKIVREKYGLDAEVEPRLWRAKDSKELKAAVEAALPEKRPRDGQDRAKPNKRTGSELPKEPPTSKRQRHSSTAIIPSKTTPTEIPDTQESIDSNCESHSSTGTTPDGTPPSYTEDVDTRDLTVSNGENHPSTGIAPSETEFPPMEITGSHGHKLDVGDVGFGQEAQQELGLLLTVEDIDWDLNEDYETPHTTTTQEQGTFTEAQEQVDPHQPQDHSEPKPWNKPLDEAAVFEAIELAQQAVGSPSHIIVNPKPPATTPQPHFDYFTPLLIPWHTDEGHWLLLELSPSRRVLSVSGYQCDKAIIERLKPTFMQKCQELTGLDIEHVVSVSLHMTEEPTGDGLIEDDTAAFVVKQAWAKFADYPPAPYTNFEYFRSMIHELRRTHFDGQAKRSPSIDIASRPDIKTHHISVDETYDTLRNELTFINTSFHTMFKKMVEHQCPDYDAAMSELTLVQRLCELSCGQAPNAEVRMQRVKAMIQKHIELWDKVLCWPLF